MAIYAGLIFASLDEEAPDLEDYLGDFRFYLDFYMGQSAEGAELHGPQRFSIKANWKIGAENFSGDTYHTPHTHASVVDIDLFSATEGGQAQGGRAVFRRQGRRHHLQAARGRLQGEPLSIGYPDEMIDRCGRRWIAAHRAMVGDAGFMPSASTVLPNLSFVHNWPVVNDDGLVVPFVSVRLWQPISATETEVFSWFAVDRNAPDWYKAASYKAYLMCFGSSGMFEQDDVENWTSITQMAKGMMAERLNLHSRMGLMRDGTP